MEEPYAQKHMKDSGEWRQCQSFSQQIEPKEGEHGQRIRGSERRENNIPDSGI